MIYRYIPVSNYCLFSGINISQVLRFGGVFSHHFAANLSLSIRKNFENRLRFDKVTAMSLVTYFFGTQCKLTCGRNKVICCGTDHGNIGGNNVV